MRTWQKMLSGRKLDLLNPSAMDIEIEDIAHGLSRVAKWGGQTAGDHAFSVAQHSLLVEQIARTLQPSSDASWFLAALLFNAADYAVGDMVTPLKEALGEYSTFESKLMQAIHVRFGLPAVVSPLLKKFITRSDRAATYLEATQIAGFSEAESRKIFGPPPVTLRDWKVEPVSAPEAKKQFLARFYALIEQRESSAA
jgi:5'-deoxynucleotidase YfbR-like HD superfamily hydrolase